MDRETSLGMDKNTQLKEAFFKQMQASEIRYCVLRNHGDVFSKTPKGDVDFLSTPTQFKQIKKTFIALCEQYGFKVLYSGQSNKNLILKAMSIDIKLSVIDTPRIIHFHFVPYVSLYLTEVQRNYAGLATRVWMEDVNTINYPSDNFSFMVPNLKWQLVFNYARLEFKHKDRYKLKCEELNELLVCNGLINFQDESFEKFNRKLLVALYLYAKDKPQLFKIVNWVCVFTLMMKDLFKQKGLVIVFSGPDGAGKTTTNEALTSFMQEKLELDVRNVKHLYPINNWLGGSAVKAQSKLRGLDLSEKDALERDRGSGPLFKIRRLIGLFSILVQYPLGLSYARFQALKGVSTIVDTSIFDAFVKGHRPQYKLLEKTIIPLLPKASLWFVLRANPKVIVARKPELTVDEITDYYSRINMLSVKSNSTIIDISSENGESVALKEVSSIVINNLNKQMVE